MIFINVFNVEEEKEAFDDFVMCRTMKYDLSETYFKRCLHSNK